MGRIVIPSPAPPEAVLAAIREDGREWRESVVPPELRGELRYRVEVRVKGDRFRLALPSRLEGPENVTLHGTVSPAPDGGSLVHARFRREVGGRIVPGQEPVRFFEMNLRRVGDTDWPGAGAIPQH